MKPVEYKVLTQPPPGQAAQRGLVRIWPDRVEAEYSSAVTGTVLGGEVIPARDVSSVGVIKHLLTKPLVTVTLCSGDPWAFRVATAADAERCQRVLEHIRDVAAAGASARTPRRLKWSGSPRPIEVPRSRHRRYVVGISSRQSAFAGHGFGPVMFALRPEPNNPYDHQAVAVDLDGHNVGYLKRDTGYFEALAGRQALVHGEVEDFNDGFGGVVYIPSPQRLRLFLDGQVQFIDARRARLKELGKFQPALHRHLGQRHDRTVPCVLEVSPAPSGKYKGEPCIRALVDGEVVGTLAARWQREEPAIFRAVVEEGMRQAWVDLTVFYDEATPDDDVVAFLNLDAGDEQEGGEQG